MKHLMCGLCLISLSACAERPEDIEPSYISGSKYVDWNCQKIANEKAFVDDALVRASNSQNEAADRDALMVFLIGVPTSNGGIKGEVARLKGEQEALRVSLRDRGCVQVVES